MKQRVKWIVLVLLLALPALAQRTLEFERMAVQARLDSFGALHVSEELKYVFDGDWNGGERVVRLGEGQRFTFENLSRREPTGELKPLTDGSLDYVDSFVVASDASVRWRSRLPSDPPFRNARIIYVLEYTLSNVLRERGGRYFLNHDFAFPERPGVIRQMTVDLELDPVWKSESANRHFEAGPLPVGKGFVIKDELEFTGGGPRPEAVHDPLYERIALVAILLFLPWLLWWMLLRREEKLGRFVPLNPSAITPQWIEQNLVTIPAEVAGAAWDEDVDKHEVSALLARWVGEGKVKSTSSRSEMKLELLVPRETFEGHERELIDKLFFDGDKTSTAAIKTHYASKGFNPSAIISRGVRARAEELAQLNEKALRLGSLITIPAFLAGVYFLYRAWKPNEGGLHTGVIIVLCVMAFFSLTAAVAAMLWRGRIDHGRVEMIPFCVVIVLVVLGALVMVAGNFVSFDAQAGVSAFTLMFASLIIHFAKSRRGPGAIAFRKRLASARQFFTDELQKPEPAIDDRWFPYVIAFGLDDQASSWATRFGASGSSGGSHSSSSASSSSSSSSSSQTPSWSGGGGAFGGAGATGTWAAAAGGLAAGVAAPSSSSSGGGGSSSSSSGGGGGGGSSSGGGSGGGW